MSTLFIKTVQQTDYAIVRVRLQWQRPISAKSVFGEVFLATRRVCTLLIRSCSPDARSLPWVEALAHQSRDFLSLPEPLYVPHPSINILLQLNLLPKAAPSSTTTTTQTTKSLNCVIREEEIIKSIAPR